MLISSDPRRRWLLVRHLLAAAFSVVTVVAGWFVLTTPFAVFSALAFGDVSGYSSAGLAVAMGAAVAAVLLVPVTAALERIVVRRGRGWFAVVALAPLAAVVPCGLVDLLAVVLRSAVTAESGLLLLATFTVSWATLWVLTFADYLLHRVRRMAEPAPPSSARWTIVRHALSVAATAIAPVLAIVAVSLPLIALGIVLDRITAPENRIGSDWAGYLHLLLWTLAAATALGVLILPMARAFERKVATAGSGWAAAAVLATVAAPVLGVALSFAWLLAGVAAIAAWAAVGVLLLFPVYWSTLWFWRFAPHARDRIRRWRQEWLAARGR